MRAFELQRIGDYIYFNCGEHRYRMLNSLKLEDIFDPHEIGWYSYELLKEKVEVLDNEVYESYGIVSIRLIHDGRVCVKITNPIDLETTFMFDGWNEIGCYN